MPPDGRATKGFFFLPIRRRRLPLQPILAEDDSSKAVMNHLRTDGRTDGGARQLEVDGATRETEAPKRISLGHHCATIRLLSSVYHPSAQSPGALMGARLAGRPPGAGGSNELTSRALKFLHFTRTQIWGFEIFIGCLWPSAFSDPSACPRSEQGSQGSTGPTRGKLPAFFHLS